MKILEVASSLEEWGGIERYVVYAAHGLSDRGHEVTVAAPRDSPIAGRVRTPLEPIRSRRRFDLEAAADYLRLYRSQTFDVVHVHFTPDVSVAAITAKIAHQPSVILTRHTAQRWNPVKARLYSRIFDQIIPASNAVEEALVLSGVPAGKMSQAKAGCPALVPTADREQVRAGLGFQGFTCGYFGRLVPEKGVDLAIEACKKMGIALAVFGEGPEQVLLEELAKGGKTSFMGRVDEVADTMNAVDAVLIPSRWAEAFPFSALEAMSLGKPIVAAKVGGLPELIEDGTTGLLFRREDVGDLSQKIGDLIRSPEKCASLSVESKDLHRRYYTVEAMADRLERVFRETTN